MAKKNTLERGKFKELINNAFYKNEDIMRFLFGDLSGMTAKEKRAVFKKRVMSHLFIDDTILETGSYIFYDIQFPNMRSQIKDCEIILYAICHRDDIDKDFVANGYSGNKIDVLTEMIEGCLINDEEVNRKFGIGQLNLVGEEPFTASHFYGHIMTFEVPNFR